MITPVEHLTSLLELPGLSKLVKSYTKVSVNVDNKNHLNRKQFQTMRHTYTITVFSYGDLPLNHPKSYVCV